MPSSLTTVSDKSSFWMPVTAEKSAEQPLHKPVFVNKTCAINANLLWGNTQDIAKK